MYLGTEDLPQEPLIGNSAVNVEFLEKKTGAITAGAYLLSITEIVNSVQHIGTGALLIVNNYIFDQIWGTDFICLFDLHSKDENGNSSSSDTAVLLKIDTLHSLENYRSVYYNAHPMTLYFQLQFIKVNCTINAKGALKCLFKKEQLSAKL